MIPIFLIIPPVPPNSRRIEPALLFSSSFPLLTPSQYSSGDRANLLADAAPHSPILSSFFLAACAYASPQLPFFPGTNDLLEGPGMDSVGREIKSQLPPLLLPEFFLRFPPPLSSLPPALQVLGSWHVRCAIPCRLNSRWPICSFAPPLLLHGCSFLFRSTNRVFLPPPSHLRPSPQTEEWLVGAVDAPFINVFPRLSIISLPAKPPRNPLFSFFPLSTSWISGSLSQRGLLKELTISPSGRLPFFFHISFVLMFSLFEELPPSGAIL